MSKVGGEADIVQRRQMLDDEPSTSQLWLLLAWRILRLVSAVKLSLALTGLVVIVLLTHAQ